MKTMNLFSVLIGVLLLSANGFAQSGNPNAWVQLTEEQVQQFASNPQTKTADVQWLPLPETSALYMMSKEVNAVFAKPEVWKFDPADSRYSFDDVTVYNKDKTEIVRFSHKVRVMTYVVPNTVVALNSYSFSSDVRINMLFFSNGLRHIGYRAFYQANHIDNIILPPTVQTVGEEAFAGMRGLTHNIFIMAAEPPVVTGNKAFSPNVQVIVPKGSAAKYRSAPGWKSVRSIKETLYLLPNGQPVLTTGTDYQPLEVQLDGNCVDLGLSVKWASRNLGANKPEEAGLYYAWGETKPKEKFRYDNYRCLTPTRDMADLGQNISNTKYDAARATWADGWRLPTKAECEELVQKCTWQWTTQNGVEGMLVTGPNGNSIFLPAGGSRDDYQRGLGNTGDFWTGNVENQSNAYYMNINKAFLKGSIKGYWRCQGRMIRPVKD